LARFKVYLGWAIFATFVSSFFILAIYVELLCLCSSFEDIFDVDHFIDVLRDEVSIVKELPGEYSWSTREYYATGIRATRIKTAPVHATADWYIENVLPILQRYVKSLTSNSATLFHFSPKSPNAFGFCHHIENVLIEAIAASCQNGFPSYSL
jgi:hypothetical protein